MTHSNLRPLRHLSGDAAMARVVDAQKRFFRRHGRVPEAMTISHRLALYLLKLGAAHFGEDYAAALWRNGVVEFARRGFHGLRVTIAGTGCRVTCH